MQVGKRGPDKHWGGIGVQPTQQSINILYKGEKSSRSSREICLGWSDMEVEISCCEGDFKRRHKTSL